MQKLNEILNLAEIEASKSGLAVVGVRFTQQGKRRTLEITIYRKGGRISLSDCEELSRKIEYALDEQSPPLIEGTYLLEVQSPGLDRELKTEREFELFKDEEVEVRTKENLNGLGSAFTGKLQALESGLLTILCPRQKESVNPGAKKKKKKAQADLALLQMPDKLSIEWSKVAQVNLFALTPESQAIPLSEDASGN